MEASDQTNPPNEASAPPARPRPSWYLRWGKATALWLCGFAVGGAAVYGVLWGKEQYDAYHTLQAMHLPAPEPAPAPERPKDEQVVKLFAPDEAPKEVVAAASPPPPQPAPVTKVVRAKPAKQARPRATVLAKAPVRKQARLAERRAAPRVLEIRRANVAGELRRPCRRGDLARECYVAR